MMNIELTPRLNLTPNELKRLGAALEAWFATFLCEHADVDGWLDEDALADLAAGELPKPFILRCLTDPPKLNLTELSDALEQARARHPLLQRSLPPVHGRCVPFGLCLGDGDEDEVLASLRHGGVPVAFVESIRVNGKERLA